MKRKAAMAAAILAIAAMSFSACGNFASGVYGPPPEDFEETEESSVTENSAPESGENEDTTQEKESDGQ